MSGVVQVAVLYNYNRIANINIHRLLSMAMYKWKYFKLVISGCLLSVGILYTVFQLKNLYSNSSYISPIITNQNSLTPKSTQAIIPKIQLKDSIAKSLEGTADDYAIVIKNLKTGDSYFQNEHTVYQPASLYKLWVMATAYEQIKNGLFTEDTVLSQNASILNSRYALSSESAEIKSGRITFTVADALEEMIVNSHNYAALLLSDRVKLKNVQIFLDDKGLEESAVGTTSAIPTTTAYDIASFFEKLYKKELANSLYTDKMLDLLKGQTINHKLPKYLPKETIIAHKTGELDSFTHDAGIVYTSNGDYIIVILSDTPTPAIAGEKIAELSRAVYNYFTKK